MDVLVANCFNSLTRGCLIADVHCPSCQLALPPEESHSCKCQDKEHKRKCFACDTQTSYSGDSNPLGQNYPVLREVEGATGIFLAIKGKPPLVGDSYIPEHAGPQLQMVALGISSLTLDLSGEIKALQGTNPILQLLRYLAKGVDPHYYLCVRMLY